MTRSARPHAGPRAPRSESGAPGVPLVAVIGRPNVGKSTLVNRILGARRAMVHDAPGVTRDRLYADCAYRGRRFQVVDTGGLDLTTTDGLPGLIRRQSLTALDEADGLCVVMDGRAGLTPSDRDIAALLRGVDKPVWFAINKIDAPSLDPLLADFYHLGPDVLFPVSAEHGIGVDELLEAFLQRFPAAAEARDPEPPDVTRVAVVGRPNVGKSTLVNTLLGEARVLVGDAPGTTRDPVDAPLEYRGRHFVLTDTAGLRRRGRVERGIEGVSVSRAIRALGRSDVGVLLLDGLEGVTEQDTKIAGLIQQQGRGCVMLVNKWDRLRDHPGARDRVASHLQRRFPFCASVPVLFGSARETRTIAPLLARVTRVMAAFSHRVPTGRLNHFLQDALRRHPMPSSTGRRAQSVFMTQAATRPPTFALFVGKAVTLTPAYLRYLDNQLRHAFGFEGAPLRIVVRKKP